MATPGAGPGPNQRSSRKRPADYTGQLQQKQSAEHAKELEERAGELALVNAQRAQEIDTVIEVGPTELNEPKVNIRVNYPIEDMTFGRQVIQPGDPSHPLGPDAADPYVGDIQMHTFEEGHTYNVARDLAEHLDKLGYLWH